MITIKQACNRFDTWLNHVGKTFKYKKLDIAHLTECKYCKKGFDKWSKENK